MKVPAGQPKIAQRFNAGLASTNRIESRRDGRNGFPNRPVFFRPCGALFPLFDSPTVETVGYSHPPLRGCAATSEQQKPVEGWVDRILAAKAQAASADVSASEREIDELVYALYGRTPEEIKIVEYSAK